MKSTKCAHRAPMEPLGQPRGACRMLMTLIQILGPSKTATKGFQYPLKQQGQQQQHKAMVGLHPQEENALLEVLS